MYSKPHAPVSAPLAEPARMPPAGAGRAQAQPQGTGAQAAGPAHDRAWRAAGLLALAPPLAAVWGSVVAGMLLAAAVLAVLALLRRREQRLLAGQFEALERARVTLHSIADAVVTTDAQERIEYLNPTAESLLMCRLADVRGQPLQQICALVDEASHQPVPHPISSLLKTAPGVPAPAQAADEPGQQDSHALLRGDGSTLPIAHRSAAIHDRHGAMAGAVMVFNDVTAVRRMAQRISWTSTHDALTGLVNRRELEARAAVALQSTTNSGTSHVLACLNIDQFKLINDSFGHGAGDSLLKQIAVLLQSRLREADTLARLDGDSFGVLLAGCGLEAAERIAHGLLDTLRDSQFTWEGRSLTLQASIGLTALGDHAAGSVAAFAAADAACTAAKDQGRNRVCVFRGSDALIVQRRNDMGWAARLNAALEDERFMLYYQAYQALGEAPANGPAPARHVEILLRLQDEQGHTVPPGEFMPAAERYNVMPAIDRWVIRTVFSRYRDLATQLGNPALTCAINLSGTSLNAEGLLEFIQIQARSHDLPPGAVCFEVTETAAIHNLQQAAQFMTAVKALGFSFALDDFGVGSSSFGYLKHLPVDLLKIDGSFVRDMVQDPVDRAMVDTINRVGHIMGLKTVAEFAENAQIIDGLRLLGVDYAQGYGVHRPQPLPGPLAVLAPAAAETVLQPGARPLPSVAVPAVLVAAATTV